MPSFGGILKEIAEAAKGADPASATSPQDRVRRKYLALAAAYSGRPIVLYATKWTQISNQNPPAGLLMITEDDIHGFMEATHGIDGTKIDLILHSPGGSPTAAEAIVQYLRSRFDDIRVIVPHMAMSAATMIACAADSVVMGKHSFLGPIDPQLPLQTALGSRIIPAQAIIEQFQLATQECKDPEKLRAWLPMLQQYGPDLLILCRNASQLAEELVGEWLAKYMFAGDSGSQERAAEIARWLSEHNNFKSHGRTLSRDVLREKGLKIDDLENDQKFQDLYLSAYHAAALTFAQTGAVKIIENSAGKAFMKIANTVVTAKPAGAAPLGVDVHLPQPRGRERKSRRKK